MSVLLLLVAAFQRYHLDLKIASGRWDLEPLSQVDSGLLSRICFRSEYCDAIRVSKHDLFKTSQSTSTSKVLRNCERFKLANI